MRSLQVLVLCTALLSTAAQASDAAFSQEEPGSSAAVRSGPDAFALGPTLGALGGGVLLGAPGGMFFLGSTIGQGGPAYHLLAIPMLGPTAGLVLGDLLTGHAPVVAWGGTLLGAAAGTAGGVALLYGSFQDGAPPGMAIYGLVGMALLPPVGAVLGRGLVLALTGNPAPVVAGTRPSVAWSLVPARLGLSGTGIVVTGWF